MKDLIFKYLNKDYQVIEYNYKAMWPPKKGYSIFDRIDNECIGWMNLVRSIAFLFDISREEANSISEEWFDIVMNTKKSTNERIDL